MNTANDINAPRNPGRVVEKPISRKITTLTVRFTRRCYLLKKVSINIKVVREPRSKVINGHSSFQSFGHRNRKDFQ